MDTWLQNLRSAFHTITEHPSLALAAAMGLGFRLEVGVTRDTVMPHARRPLPAAHAPAPSHPATTWMDYIDFRRGSGDVLRWIGTSEQTGTPRRCGAME